MTKLEHFKIESLDWPHLGYDAMIGFVGDETVIEQFRVFYTQGILDDVDVTSAHNPAQIEEFMAEYEGLYKFEVSYRGGEVPEVKGAYYLEACRAAKREREYAMCAEAEGA